MGIYAVRDQETGNVLIGSSTNVDGAINRAQFELRLGSHRNKMLQDAWTRGGAQRVTFEILDMVKERSDPDFDYAEELRTLEQLYRDELEKQK